ncbi:hypothetical protein M011DRAFT_210536 [Sporormia fimetaria CBS 119925]|uniref:Uncharacterized protein n=1 Tax=Sporormia fimetaria CBS 119925 TaxID=1340428 RepID=A0A6A6V3J7_9PLEO|nr:hypothetical protein M011DRAFT_210536 [Sporormia fimetaria CBS 119925]
MAQTGSSSRPALFIQATHVTLALCHILSTLEHPHPRIPISRFTTSPTASTSSHTRASSILSPPVASQRAPSENGHRSRSLRRARCRVVAVEPLRLLKSHCVILPSRGRNHSPPRQDGPSRRNPRIAEPYTGPVYHRLSGATVKEGSACTCAPSWVLALVSRIPASHVPRAATLDAALG